MPTSPEAYLISSILREGDFKTAIAHGVNAEMMHAFPDEFEWLETYYLRHKKTPSKVAFQQQYPEFRVKAVNDTGYFADEVRTAHARYSLTSTMREVTELIAAGDVDTAVKKAHTSIISVAAGMGHNNDGDILTSYDDIIFDVERRVQRVADKGAAGIPTGFITLDERTGGPQPGDLWVVGARLGEGKSATMQRMSASAVMSDYTVQFDALEQSRAQVAMRIHSYLSSELGKQVFQSNALMQGKDFDLKEYKTFVRTLRKNVKGKLHVSDTSRGRVGLLTIASQIERNNPDIVFVDYITLMDKKGGEWQDVAALSGGLKQIAQEYQVPIVVAAQLNRANGLGKEPAGPEALAQSDAIGQDADAVITLKQMSPTTIAMKMAKNRNGPGGFKWYCEFDLTRGVFREVTYDKAMELKDKDDDAQDKSASRVRTVDDDEDDE